MIRVVQPGAGEPAQLRLTKTFADAGVPMVAGTDACGAAHIIPGFSLHDEFDLLAEAGPAPPAILRMTTTEPARFLGEPEASGRIAPACPPTWCSSTRTR
ncbi:amidohydrolase family protein [Streptomyces sp. SID2563]|uniref:amidohydrolase family protein n=1 Tax=Streptomyces sp. SID2563 TaxID=2690255 RepID=UPI001F3CBF59|nr:amidohydrolase family protein [Streptomyces sp. SID2563]